MFWRASKRVNGYNTMANHINAAANLPRPGTVGVSESVKKINRRTARMLELLEEQHPGVDPVLLMWEWANDNTLSMSTRLECCKEVAKYVHPQRRAIDVTASDSDGLPTVPQRVEIVVKDARVRPEDAQIVEVSNADNKG